MTTQPALLQVPPPPAESPLPARAWLVALVTAIACAATGGLGLLLAPAPGFASPLYLSAGIALAAALTYGRVALPGVLLGAFAVNLVSGLLHARSGLSLVLLPLAIGAGAALQAAVGAALIRRFVGQPVVLDAPRDILRAAGLGALVACLVSPSVGVSALLLDGALGAGAAASTWFTWWLGDTAGVLIGAPLALTLIGQRRRTELAVQAATAALRRELAERAQAEKALRESEVQLRSIFDHAPIGVMFLDPRGRIIECNPRLCELIGRSAHAMRGRSVTEIVHPDEVARLRRPRRELIAGIPDAVLEPVRLRPADGRELMVRASASALRDEHGRVVRIVGVLEDITEHRRLQASEDALHRAEAANRAKSDFLSRMSHELRTPLNAMIGFSQLLGMDREPGLAPHQRDWTLQIQRAGWHLLEMINETLDLARIESGAVPLALAPLELAPLVSASRALVTASAGQRGVRLHERLARDAPALVGDATRVKQILTNLLSNAVKYNRPGGSATVSSRRASDGMVEIVVSDTGLGMTEEQQAALFQPYNRLGRENSDIEGTGIGLVISRRLAELMGGTLEATSRAGSGSTFTLRLPAAEAATPVPERYTDTSPAPYRERRVHYVEDNETNIEVMRGVFALRAQVVLETSTLGLDGLASIRRRRPDLILLDMQLPDISGIELLRYLKRDDLLADIPVVVVSADATPQHVQQALTLGAANYVTKPLDVSRFLGIIDGLLEEAETRW